MGRPVHDINALIMQMLPSSSSDMIPSIFMHLIEPLPHSTSIWSYLVSKDIIKVSCGSQGFSGALPRPFKFTPKTEPPRGTLQQLPCSRHVMVT